MKLYTVNYGRNKISFALRRGNRKTLTISVLPDLSVVVLAPQKVAIKAILERVKRRAKWIIDKIEYFKAFQPHGLPKRYISGETHRYLGRQYRLKVISNKHNFVKLSGQYLYIYTARKGDSDYNRKLLYKWYRERAIIKFNIIYRALLKKLRKYGINGPVLKVKTMKSRWGSCNSHKQTIILNTELIKAPSHCIEYVIMHELCHIKYPNHNRQFYDFLALVMPDWIERKKRLEKVVL